MRVISGSARGKKLKTVSGDKVRPTIDRVKESVFNIIQFQIADKNFLDLFSGSGQMGIEALSRGAKYVTMVDADSDSIRTIEENLKGIVYSGHLELIKTDFRAFLKQAKPKFYDVVFLDPPYGGQILNEALQLIREFDILSENGIIICESARGDVFESIYQKSREYAYGSVLITVIKR